MTRATTAELEKPLRSPLGKRARKLVREGRVYRLRQDGQRWSALVLSDLQPEETTVDLDPSGPGAEDLAWSCSCQDREPCAHILALLCQLQTSTRLPASLDSLLRGEAAPAAASSRTTAPARTRSRDTTLSLFDDAELFPVPEPAVPQAQLDLFAPEPAPVPKPAAPASLGPAPVPAAPPPPVLAPEPAPAPLPERNGAHHPWEVRRPAAIDPYAGLDLMELSPRFQIQFAETLGRTDVRLIVRYGDCILQAGDKDPVYHIAGTNRGVRRDLEAERDFRRTIARYLAPDLAWERGAYADLVGNTGPDWGLTVPLSQFLLETGRELMNQGYDILVLGKKILGSGTLSVKAEHDLDWFGVNASVRLESLDPSAADGTDSQGGESALKPGAYLHLVADDSAAPVPGLVATDGGYVALKESDLRRLAFLRQFGMDANGHLQTSSVNLNLIDTLYDALENRDDPALQHSREALGEITAILEAAYASVRAGQNDLDAEFDVPSQPAMLHARLRIYQLIGFAWLRTLHKHGYGACLADDMGLGKTMQTLSLLCSLKEEGALGPSLLVTPVVTLSNWEAEIRKFAPDLTFVRHQGTRRIQDAAHLRSHDLVIVSYQTLRNDLDLFAAHEWDCLILDEAHYIKSADSQIFKAIRVLTGKHRISLTGTPIENNAMELWAQFSFLNPGLLGTPAEFQEQFATPIERKGDVDAARALKETVRPFILRRKKQDVLAELPDKNESVHWIDMDTRQAELYEAHRRTYQEIITGLLDSQGMEKSRMEVFKYLLRLRQLAIAPVLAGQQWSDVRSAKLDALTLMLEDLVAEDNKVLVFSQFTRTLDLIAEQLEARQWQYSYLTGATADRQGEIDAFKTIGQRKIFLLSLKAGGVGINLTQANYVVLFDPWWNPAAEAQAVDRAYRMGQTRSVNAYRYITRGTIEEKILALQQRKTLLSEALVSPGEAALGRLDEETIRSLFE